MPAFRLQPGFSLMEMMIGIFLSTLLMTGIVQLLSGSVAAYRLQLSLSQMEESARYARAVLSTHISRAGYQPEPWQNSSALPALTEDAVDGGKFPGDQLGLQQWSDHNCYGNENPIKDDHDRPKFYLLQTRFFVNTSKNLALNCRYGSDTSSLKTQVKNHGLIEDVESLQILYAEDQSGDEIPDRWVTAQAWEHESDIRAVKIALLISTKLPFDKAVSENLTLLDQTITTPSDGRLRRVALVVTPIRGRL